MISIKGVLGAAAVGAISVLLFKSSPEDADYCNVALVPDLAEEIGVDLPNRIALASKGESLLDSLSGQIGRSAGSGKTADTFGKKAVESCGRKVFAMLTVDERKKFILLFRNGKIKPVTCRVEDAKNGGENFYIDFGRKGSKGKGSGWSLSKTRAELARVYEEIPSELIAVGLLNHGDEAVNSAAVKWLKRNSPDHPEAQSRSELESEERLAERRGDSEKRRAEMNRQFERERVERERAWEKRKAEWARENEVARAEHQAKSDAVKRKTEVARSTPKSDSGTDRKSYDERVAEMRKKHEANVADMRARHEARVREMRAKR